MEGDGHLDYTELIKYLSDAPLREAGELVSTNTATYSNKSKVMFIIFQINVLVPIITSLLSLPLSPALSLR